MVLVDGVDPAAAEQLRDRGVGGVPQLGRASLGKGQRIGLVGQELAAHKKVAGVVGTPDDGVEDRAVGEVVGHRAGGQRRESLVMRRLAVDLDGGAEQRLDELQRRRLRHHRDALQRSLRSEEHTSELQSLMRISYAVFCLKTKTKTNKLEPI